MTSPERAEAREAVDALFALESDAVRCPYPALGKQRAQEPVAWFPQVEAYVVTSHALIVEVLRDSTLFSSRESTIGPVGRRQLRDVMQAVKAKDPMIRAAMDERAELGTTPVLALADGDTHTRQRKLVQRAFSPAVVNSLEPLARELAGALVDEIVAGEVVDLIPTLATPLPMSVIARALGVETDRIDDFQRWSDGIVAGFGRTEVTEDEMTAIMVNRTHLETYLLQVMDAREAEPQEDLISLIIHSLDEDGERLSRHDALEMIVQFLIAGNETTTKLMAAATLRVARDPALAQRLRDDLDLLPSYISEVLRLEPPVSGLFRTATADCVLGGTQIKAGSALWLVFAAGNHDENQFSSADECVIGRPNTTPHLAFGFGKHFCLGQGLARAETRVLLELLLTRFSHFGLPPGVDEVVYEPSFLMHGIQSLPLVFKTD